MKSKKADTLMFLVICLILVLVFISFVFIYLNRFGSEASIDEQIFAKEIALNIDSARPGTIIEKDVSELYEIAKGNNFNGKVVDIDNENNKVKVNLIFGKGYEYYFFSDVDIEWEVRKNEGEEKLYMRFLESEKGVEVGGGGEEDQEVIKNE